MNASALQSGCTTSLIAQLALRHLELLPSLAHAGEQFVETRVREGRHAPRVRCRLHVVGTGMNSDGNPTFDYTGDCAFHGQ